MSKHSESIISNEKQCYKCGIMGDLHRHHVFGGIANRRLSEMDGLWIWLCPDHHTMTDNSVHRNRSMDLAFKKEAQMKWEEKYGSREDFIKRYGKSYL